MRNVRFILQLLLGFALILVAVYSPLNGDGSSKTGCVACSSRAGCAY